LRLAVRRTSGDFSVRAEKCRRADIFDFLPIKTHQKLREVRTLCPDPSAAWPEEAGHSGRDDTLRRFDDVFRGN
jgi:hypothetical protein